jgi:DNA-directed RNA polymerase sigma subunit (sigma70/sigma32)
MTQRAQQLMNEVWHERNTWADTEQKLVAAILRKVISHARTYTASSMNNLQVLDTNDLITLSKELETLT